MDTATKTDEVQDRGHLEQVEYLIFTLFFQMEGGKKPTTFNEFYFVHFMFKLTELMRQLSSSKHNKREDFFLTLLD